MPAVAAGLAIFLSWTFIHTIFALHYAHEFYDQAGGGGMAFPGGGEEPDYWDFVYFSFVIGMTSQVSDVGVTTKTVRRTVAAHGVVSFAFNTALLALSINLAASALPSLIRRRRAWSIIRGHETQDPVAPARGAAGSADRDVSPLRRQEADAVDAAA